MRLLKAITPDSSVFIRLKNPIGWLVFGLALLLFCNSGADAQPARKTSQERSTQPIHVKSDDLKADNKDRTATFTGRVVARQDDVTIYSDKLIVYYGEDEDQVDKVEAIGTVRIIQDNRIGTGGHAIYESRIGKITLSDGPKVTQDSDSVTGKTIVYYLDEERSQATGGEDTRVEAVIHPGKGGLKRNEPTRKQ